MENINLLSDASFLRELDKQRNKTYYVKILLLDKEERPLRTISGRVTSGSISLSGNSSVRRSGSIAFVAESAENDLTNIDNLISINKRIKIVIGLKNTVDTIHDSIIWFNQGIFIITQPSLSHNVSGVTINLQFQDKMCLLNGTVGGGLPTSVIFHEYRQSITRLPDTISTLPNSPKEYTIYALDDDTFYIWNNDSGWTKYTDEASLPSYISIQNKIYDIIYTLVCNYGNESTNKVIVNDVPLQLKSVVHNTSSNSIYYNLQNSKYTMDINDTYLDATGAWKEFKYNEDCAYVYTDFTYPGELISSIGDSVDSILNKIIEALGNYEYFYDLDGNFIFQEKKNYLNTQYNPIQSLNSDGYLLTENNYWVDFSHTGSSIYTFEEGGALINSYTNSPRYDNIKNDFHIWGKLSSGIAIHYHIAIKNKPQLEEDEYYQVEDILDDDGNATGRVRLISTIKTNANYVPSDWRALIYLRGLNKQLLGQRPDVYEQEILDNFDSIYNMKEKCFKTNMVDHPNDLHYWIDYINPAELADFSVDTIGQRVYSYQQDKINKLYTNDVPDIVVVNEQDTDYYKAKLVAKYERSGESYSIIPKSVYQNLAIGTVGYSAQEVARDLLYQYTSYAEAISLSSVPIYYLDVNTRITVYDKATGIAGDYIINSINVPLDGKSTMNISASKALERV